RTPSRTNRRPSAGTCGSPSWSANPAGRRAELSLPVLARSIRGPGIARVPFADLRRQHFAPCSCLEEGNLARETLRGKVNLKGPARPIGLARDDVGKRSVSDS